MSIAKQILGFGLALAIAFAIMAPVIASAAPAAATTAFTALSASELLTVDTLGTTFGQVAGLGQTDLRTTIARIIRAALAFLGVIAVVIIIWGGFKWMTSGGADEKVRDARKLIVMGIVGLAIVLSAYAIAQFVISSLATATGLS